MSEGSDNGDGSSQRGGDSHMQNHAFILRIRNEQTCQPQNEIVWRGSIEHVGSGQRFFFQDLNSILDFIQEQVCSKDQAKKNGRLKINNRTKSRDRSKK